jgi:membrane-associated phospholipid phosphatase
VTSDLPKRTGVVGPDPGVGGELRQDVRVGDTELTHWYSALGRVLVVAARAVAARVGPYTTLILTMVVGIGIAIGLSVVAVEVYDAVADSNGVAGLDRPILDWMLTLRDPVTNTIVTGFTDIAGTVGMPIIAVISMLILAIHRRSWTPVILIVSASVGSLLMTIAGKDLIARQRPPLVDAVPPFEYSPSFPSGHTLNAVVVVGIIAYLVILRRTSKRARVAVGAAAVVFAVAVGISRVYLGHHWFTDVLAGFVLGAAWLSIIITAHRLYLTVRRRRTPVPSAEGGVTRPPEG